MGIEEVFLYDVPIGIKTGAMPLSDDITPFLTVKITY
jgi:hypothetical protein